MAITYLALGSNLWDRQRFIYKALDELRSSGIDILKVSSIIETDPVGGPKQSKYLNGVVKAKTLLSAEDLLKVTQSIEQKLGRKRQIFHGPRTIDIDILLYDEIKLISRRLIIPHPRMLERRFVLDPLEEIAPGLVIQYFKQNQ